MHGGIIIHSYSRSRSPKPADAAETNQSMKHALKLRLILTAGLLLGAALGCSALSLGRTRGGVWVGQPMDLRIQVKLDAGDDVAALCFAADVFHADTRVNSEQVRVSAEPGTSRDDMSVRVRSAALVDEPVVTIYLKVGCVQAVTRRYVLLADVLSNSTVLAPVPTAGALATAVPAVGTGAPVASITTSVKSPGEAIRQWAPRVAARPLGAGKAAASAAVAAEPVVRSVVRRPQPAPPKSRLKLDPLDFAAERDPVLRASTELLTVPTEGGTRRAEAAALWRAINATPEEILRDARQLQTLQSDAAALKIRNQKNEAAVADLAARLEKAQAERYGNVLVFGLLVALLVAVGAAAYFWRASRSQRQPHWWGGIRDDVGDPEVDDADLDRAPGHAAPPARHGVGVDVDLDAPAAMADDWTDRKRNAMEREAKPSVMVGADFQTSETGGSRALKVDELFDVQQQADFFISLGQYDQAVAILRNHISEKADTSALAYLDLLKIFHLQGREQDYDLVRKDFNEVFNAEVPEFADFGQQSRGLESYQSAMSRIVALWPSEKVLSVIEESIFRKPGRDSQAFDLEAYRELLLLYSVAREIVDSGGADVEFEISTPEFNLLAAEDDGALEPSPFHATSLQPLPATPGTEDGRRLSRLQVPASANLGLDIDLSEFRTDLPDLPAPSVPTATTPVTSATPTPATTAGTSTVAMAPADSKFVPDAPDGHLIDFDLFDLATRAHAASKPGKR